jgi:hypothetical protein
MAVAIAALVLGVDDVVRRAEHQPDVGDSRRVEPESPERADIGHTSADYSKGSRSPSRRRTATHARRHISRSAVGGARTRAVWAASELVIRRVVANTSLGDREQGEGSTPDSSGDRMGIGVQARHGPGIRTRGPVPTRRAARWARRIAWALLLGATAGCGRSLGPAAAHIPQPTPDRTMDAVVRGLASPVVFASPAPSPPARAAASPPARAAVRPSSPTPAAARSSRAARPGATATPAPANGQATPRPTAAPANPAVPAPTARPVPTRAPGGTPQPR